ncbi:APC family permease [Pseudonocardia charpentierae]|uniref:APC family permease n=1 Tax=Pseudonocardia charpentierae TaxID=3075545 RepID=A0ABU2N8K5_9PSEU|nr:APC family permease [Pseudonocardia sp. DSM 45834]MDT0349634.1 APC family permease [Pseudonocardia sp. DSM 45834]
MADAVADQDIESTSGQPELKRAIGPGLLLFFVIGDILGTGIYALTGSVAGVIGGALWLPFLLAFAVAFITAFSYLELVGKYPRAAGAALYTHKAFGINFLTFMVTFTVMASGVTSAATAAKAFGDTYLRQFVTLPTWAVATVFVIGLAVINFRGVGESVKANVVLTCIELSGLLLIIGVGVYAVMQGRGDASRLVEINTGDTSAFLAITAATSLAFFAMVGFEDSVNMAEECHNPPRIFPRAMLLGMGVAAAIYVIVAVLSSMLVPADVLAAAKSDALFKVLDAGAPGFPLAVFAAIGLFAVVNSALINMLMASRLLYGMANERIIPRPFGRVHQNRRTPWVSIVFTSAVAIVLVISADITLLGGTTALLLLAVFTIVNVAVLVLRRRDPVDRPHFRAPGWAPYAGIVLCGFLATPLSGRPLQQFLVAGILLAVGVVLWVINRLVVGRVDVDPTHLTKG